MVASAGISTLWLGQGNLGNPINTMVLFLNFDLFIIMTKTNAQLFNHPSTHKGLEHSLGFYSLNLYGGVEWAEQHLPPSLHERLPPSFWFQADTQWLPSMDQGPWQGLRSKGKGNIIGSSEHIGRHKTQTNKLIERRRFRIRLYKSKSQPPAGPVNLGINLLHLKKRDP